MLKTRRFEGRRELGGGARVGWGWWGGGGGAAAEVAVYK